VSSWSDVVQHVERNYKVRDRKGDLLALVFSLPGDRTQIVFVSRSQTGGGQDWVAIESPIGNPPSRKVINVVQAVDSMVCGGVIAKDDVLFLKHAVPVTGFSPDEFDWALRAITTSADQLEERFVKGDRF
jgi:hypothetical protein